MKLAPALPDTSIKLGRCVHEHESISQTKKVQVGNDQEKGEIRKKFPFQKPRWEN